MMSRNWRLVCLAAALSSCFSSEDDNWPHYQFTALDREWQQHQAGTEWNFTDGRGGVRRFRIDSVVTRQRLKPALIGGIILLGSNQPEFYYDTWRMELSRLDSAGPVGQVEFSTEARHQAPERVPVVGAEGFWYSYIGADSGSGGVYCQNLGLYNPHVLPAEPLTVLGWQYNHVVKLRSTGQPSAGCYYYPTRTSTRTVYYDRTAGIVRMEELDGTVWLRVP